MQSTNMELHDQVVEIAYPDNLRNDVDSFFGRANHPAQRSGRPSITIHQDGTDRYVLKSRFSPTQADLNKSQVLTLLLEEVVSALVFGLTTGVALHAGAVSLAGKTVLVAGPSGAGKSSLVAWFGSKGFDYLSDELAILIADNLIKPFPRPLVVKPGSREQVSALGLSEAGQSIDLGENLAIPLEGGDVAKTALPCGLVIFVQHVAGAGITIEPLSPAQSAHRLMASNLNANNLLVDGLPQLKSFAMATPAVRLTYGDFDQLEGVLDRLARLSLDENWTVAEARRFLSAFAARSSPPRTAAPAVRPARPIPSPTPRRFDRKLTIGMATYDDYDGVYFTLQSLRLYHPEVMDEVELLVIDNHPSGPCGEALKNLENVIPNYRYVPFSGRTGTTIRDVIFREAGGEYVLSIDCHILILSGGVRRLLAFYEQHPTTADLLQGPMIYDDLKKAATHWDTGWRGGMYGTWADAQDVGDLDGEPFDIPMQGLGLFSCRKAVWPGFNSAFRGFGGEEGYIHEKFRQAGGRTLCLPFLQWVHRFNRPMGVPYPNIWEDRVRNYLIGFAELGLPTTEMESHFTELLGEALAKRIFADARQEIRRLNEAADDTSSGVATG